MKKILPFIFLGCMSQLLSAQTHNMQKAIEARNRSVKEKMKIDQQEFLQILQSQMLPSLSNENHKPTERFTEWVVSGVTDPESEIHAAINTTDTSNIICSPNNSGSASLSSGLNPIYYTHNFGQTWQQSSFSAIAQPGAFIAGGGDPMFVFDKNGVAYFSWINLWAASGAFDSIYWDLCWASSTNGGTNWTMGSQPIAHSSGALLSFSPDIAYDKQWMACDKSNSAFANTIYCVFFEANTITGDFMIGLRKKNPGAANFSSVTIPVSDAGYTDLQFSSIAIDDNGAIHVSFCATLDGSNWSLYHSMSTDGGNTFDTDVKISDFHLPNLSGDQPGETFTGIDTARIYPCPHLRIDNSGGVNDGNVYAVWSGNGISNNLGKGGEIYFSRSVNNGITWSNAVVLNDNTNNLSSDQFYPSMEVNANGVVAVAWYDRRGDAANSQTHYYMAYSFDGGASFEKSFQVTQQPTDFTTIGSANGNFGVGEYNHIVCTDHYAIPFWADGRSNDGDMDIYAALIPIAHNLAGVHELQQITEAYSIGNVLPNPSVNVAEVQLHFSKNMNAELFISSMDGRKMKQLFSGTEITGDKKINFDLTSFSGGNYYLVLKTSEGTTMRKFSVAK